MEEKKLSEFLKENGAYESFVENCLNEETTLHSIKYYSLSNIGISDGFTWVDTPQGRDYWTELNCNFYKLNGINDMDEILYKEYEKRNMKESSKQNLIPKDIVENGEEIKVENTKQEFQTITLNKVKIKDKLLEAFCPDIPKVDYEQYVVIIPLKDKNRFEDMFGDLEETTSKGVDASGISFNEYTDQVFAYKVKSQKEILEGFVGDFRKGFNLSCI